MTQQYEAIGLSVPNFSGNEKKYVNEAIDAEWVSTAGAFISRFDGGAPSVSPALRRGRRRYCAGSHPYLHRSHQCSDVSGGDSRVF